MEINPSPARKSPPFPIVTSLANEEEAVEINPESNVESPDTASVLDPEIAPDTVKVLSMVEEA